MTSYAHSNFCWFELATTDQKAAKAFYNAVFGWTANDVPMGPDVFYTMLQLNGSDVGALYGMDQAQIERGVPPHWNLYVSVTSADATAAKAAELGGKVILPAFDVMEHGRMAIIQDPTGAMICLWQPNKMAGAVVVDEPNAFCWFENYTNDTEAAKAFYTSLFGWGTGGDANYTEWKVGEKSIGGMMKIQAEWGDVPPHWIGYVMVDDVDQTAAKVKAAGGKLMMEPMDIPNVGRFALCDDPQNAGFAIYSPLKK